MGLEIFGFIVGATILVAMAWGAVALRPGWVLFGFAAAVPCEGYLGRTALAPAFEALLVPLCLLVCGWMALALAGARLRIDPLAIPLWTLCAIALVSSLVAEAPLPGLLMSLKLLELLVLYAVVATYPGAGSCPRFLVAGFLVGALTTAIVALAWPWTGPIPTERLADSANGCNELGFMMAVAAGVALFTSLSASRLVRLGSWLGMGVFAAALLASASRAAAVGLVGGVIGVGLLTGNWARPLLRLAVLSAAVGVVLPLGLVGGQRYAMDRLASLGHVRANRVGDRASIWLLDANIVAARPWLGIGPMGFASQCGRYADVPAVEVRVSTPESRPLRPHNDYLGLLAEMGPLAALAWVAAILRAISLGRRSGGSPDQRVLKHAMLHAVVCAAIVGLSQDLVQREIVWLAFAALANATRSGEAAERPLLPRPPANALEAIS